MERPAGVEEWFQRLPQLLSVQGWEIASDRHGHGTSGTHEAAGTLSHCLCPWGGRLIKITLDCIAIKDPPQDSSHVLVRPEVRAQFLKEHPEYSAAGYGVFGFELLNHVAPGHAVVKTWALWSLFRLCTVLFGQLSSGHGEEGSARQRLVRDFPRHGDATYTHSQDFGEIRDVLLICRPTMLDAFDVQVIFSVQEDKFAHWAVPQFARLMESARKSTEWFLNRPGVNQLRQLDEDFYTILAIQSWQRGPPFLPARTGDGVVAPTVTIDAGEKLGLTSWSRFHPPGEKFLFSQYLEQFLEYLLGEQIDVFSSLDGRQLVPYQAAVLRQKWSRIRMVFSDAFSLQKTAYRRANGGTTAPNVHEDVKPRFLPHGSTRGNDISSAVESCVSQEAPQHKVVVRRTFLEVETDDEEIDFDCSERHGRRYRTVNSLCTDRSGPE